MNLNVSPLRPLSSSIHFSGSGKSGNPRVLVATSSSLIHCYEELRNRSDIELVWISRNPDEFKHLLTHGGPIDVIIVDVAFDYYLEPSPGVAVKSWLTSNKGITPPGIILNSPWFKDCLNRYNCLQVHWRGHFENQTTFANELAKAIHQLDPKMV